jgi:alkylation response protein AidB-like acyl-CoA dehydrogenase
VATDRLFDLRAAVREFLSDSFSTSVCDGWLRAFDPDFSREIGRRGWVGMTVPREMGGPGRSHLERYAVAEELLFAGAPIAYHWFADRETVPTLLASGNRRLQHELLPAICRGEVCVCVGISERGAGSDVSAISTSVRRSGHRWIIDGEKTWTAGAGYAQYCHLLARSVDAAGEAQEGLVELLVPMDAAGITIRPIVDLLGEAHFAEIVFDGVETESWRMISGECDRVGRIAHQLDYERSGPELFLTTAPLFQALLDEAQRSEAEHWLPELGAVIVRVSSLRAMSAAAARAMDAGAPPPVDADLVKDLGATLDQEVIALARDMLDDLGPRGRADVEARLGEALLLEPTFTLCGRTTEISPEIVARRILGLERN